MDVAAEVRRIVAAHQEEAGRVTAVLGDIQKKYRYLPEEALVAVSEALGVPLARLFEVATFYAAFSLVPKGRVLVSVCHGTACHVRGAPLLTERLEEELGISPGETTPDGEFSLEVVRCLGCCSLAPVVRVGDRIYGRVRPAQLSELLREGGGEK